MAEKKKYNYGGQAVIEGVMIRGRSSVVTAIRRPQGDIALDIKPAASAQTSWARRTPLVRGVVILIEAMVLGIKTLMFSANIAMEEEGEEIPTKAIWGMILISVALAVGLFFLAPLFLTKLVNNYLPNTLAFTIIEGVIRIAIFIGYLKIIGMMSDVKRVFTYHGAEHKAVNAFEAGVPILPVIMGLGYEMIYFGARHTNNWLMKIVLAPGLWLQSMTTGEPDEKQLEVAIAALTKAVEIDKEEAAKAAA
jgi:uncharacterized protein YqhQ